MNLSLFSTKPGIFSFDFSFKKATYIFFCLCFFRFLPISAQSSINETNTITFGNLSYPQAINISGKQRMLSQRMSKAYLLQTSNLVDFSVNKELLGSIKIFEENLDILLTNANTEKVKNSLLNVRDYWLKFRALLFVKPNRTTANLILENNTYMLELCDITVNEIEDQYEDLVSVSEKEYQSIRLVNISGKQRMLSQRLCLYYIGVKLFPKKQNNYQLVLRNTFNEFDGAIMRLLTNPDNDFSLRRPFSEVLSEWEKLKTKKAALYQSDISQTVIYKTTNKLTKIFDKITGMYEEFSY